MFVITELEDRVEIRAAAPDKKKSVVRELETRYSGRLVDGLGLAVRLHAVCSIAEYEMHGEKLVASVTFRVLFYRFYTDEISIGTILRQNEDGIVVGDSLFKNYEVQAIDLFENSEFISDGRKSQWVWNYKNSRLPFAVGDTVKFRIQKTRFEDAKVEACMNEQGLGPCSWWD